MKKLLFALAIVTFLWPMQNEILAHSKYPVLPQFFKKVTLKAGKTIYLETSEQVYSDHATVGQLIQFKVKMDVFAEKKKGNNNRCTRHRKSEIHFEIDL